MLNFWAFKVGISLALIYASITTKPGVVNLAMVTVFAVFALSTIVSIFSLCTAFKGLLDAIINASIVAVSCFVFGGFKLRSSRGRID
uniref:DUF2512 family protein n=1 Tax=Mesocestoides corti TaxID=53468 RepID=A0A5K3F2S5_MESCO